jgi:hypothetical protein
VALTETAAERYKGLLTAVVPALNPELRAEMLRPMIDAAVKAREDPTADLSEHIAAHSRLTVGQLEPIVEAALAGTPSPDSEEKAAAVSQAVASTLSGVNVELSEAIPLEGVARLGFAIMFTVALVGCIIGVVSIGVESAPSETAMITLSVIAILAAVGVLVLVMGYKTAKIKLGS